ncbi:hypothetical protein SLEP1_g38363 [Rubroshorea leprosula]|nr:hypothetical protein SLEP1_g38363 [Rubroshorea leprosula]
MLISGLPVPSWELNLVTRAKAWATFFLEWRGPREAGFTEQRKPPPLGSGRITGWCFSGLPWHNRLILAGPSPF